MSIEDAIAREHVRATLARYHIAGDSRNLAAFLGVFTDDALFTSPIFHCDGKSAIAIFFKERWFAVPSGPTARFVRHNITTTQIDLVDAHTAQGRVYYVVFSDLGPDHSGHYIDRYREENGRWLICEREVLLDWCNPASLYVSEQVKRLLIELNKEGTKFTPVGKGSTLSPNLREAL